MPDLRILEYLVELVDRAARHAGFRQQIDQCRRSVTPRMHRNRFVQRNATLRTQVRVGVIRIPGEGGITESFGHARENRIAGRRDVDEAVRSRIDAGRHRSRVVVAGLSGDLAFDQPARRLEIHHRDHRREQRALHPLAFAGTAALLQRNQYPERGEQSGAEVRNRDAGAHRALAGQARYPHQATHALRDLVEPGAVAIRSVLAESGDARVD